ncbi:hypothetical protein [Acidovorax sp. sic0104]|uniref:hypothetical protein n=1 Tax=Acidovorax sp. sic0104 TaxID=2854784 RepID=UPI001C47FAAE|nr:hypothetical protein [Acidovorax sp. sic0104]MBV7542020.1 hypothetical protein [Acidovorax sp. sic0104]
MKTTISFSSMQDPVHNVRCTFVRKGEPLHYGLEGFADAQSVVIEAAPLDGVTGPVVNVIKAKATMSFATEYSAFSGVTLSETDTDALREWALQHMVSQTELLTNGNLPDERPAIDVPMKIDKVATIRHGSSRYAVILAKGRDHQILLDDEIPAAESLRKHAADNRARALRYLAYADMADAAATLI